MTTAATYPRGAACPACVAVQDIPGHNNYKSTPHEDELRRIELSLPEIHCANCITGVESSLGAMRGVAAARVNLTLKRVSITVSDAPGVEQRLISDLAQRGYDARPLDSAALEATRTDAAGRMILARIGIAGFALMSVMLLSVSVWAGAAGTTRDLMHWMSALISIPAVAIAAYPFFTNAWKALAGRRLDMDVPISTAILLALGVSIYETARSGEHAFFDAALMLTFFLLIGRYLSHLARTSARSAAAEIAALEVHLAERVMTDGTRETVPVDALRDGDLVAVPAGARIPADGTVTSGMSEIDPSLLTGETMPEPVAPGALVRAGMLNLSGPVEVRVDHQGEETLLQQISRLVEVAEQSRGHYASLASRASRWYSHIVNILAVAALLGWGIIGGDWRLAVNIAAAVLIITCPCALGLAVPAVLTTASGRLFRRGVLLKDGEALERLAEVDVVVFDKTGTLTWSDPALNNASDLTFKAISTASALSRNSTHPLSRSIAAYAVSTGTAPTPLTDFTEHPGRGSQGFLADGTCVRLGRADWVGAHSGAETGNQTATWLRVGNEPAQVFIFNDQARPGVRATISGLADRGLRTEILSGDAPAPVERIARDLNIENWTSGADPTEKVAHLNALREKGHKVLMVGDGLNDAAALAAAYVSVSPASATDASRTSADMIILGDRLDRITEILDIAKISNRRIRQNFGLALGYNIITVPLAFAGFVTPLIAAVAMSASSVLVSLNAMRPGQRP